MTRIFLSAGESSGDMHGASLVRALHALEPHIQCEGLGGRRMAAAGMVLHHDLAGQAIMGFSEVVRRLGYIRRVFRQTAGRLSADRPDCLVVIDYPGFNIRLAAEAHRLGIPVVYYISPQIWAWKRKRVETIAQLVRKMLVILPFEKPLYDAAGVDCVYVGHPLPDHAAQAPVQGVYAGSKVVGLLPGSREQEIRRHLPVMLEVARRIRGKHADARFIVPCVDEAREAQIRANSGGFPLETTVGNAYEVLGAARFCLVASGTATVETAYFQTPMVIMYKVSPLSYALARMLVKVEHIGMVNILAGTRIVPEFVQREANADRIAPHALELMDDTPARRTMLEELGRLRPVIGEPGASDRVAHEVLEVARAQAGEGRADG